MSRGDRREDIYHDDVDRQDFLKTLAEACQKTGFEVHAYCLMKNHFHLVVETPDANLVAGMRWLPARDEVGVEQLHAAAQPGKGKGQPRIVTHSIGRSNPPTGSPEISLLFVIFLLGRAPSPE